MSRRADAYVWLAKRALRFAQTSHELDRWWSEEATARRDVGLSAQQEAELIAARDLHRERLLWRFRNSGGYP